MLTVTLNDQTASQLTKMAAAQSISPEAIIEKAIRDLLRAEASRILARETEAFRAMHGQLLQKYTGEYIALHQGQLIDHDVDRQSRPIDLYLIKLYIGAHQLHAIRVIGINADEEAIVGRNAFNHLVITLNGLAGVTEVAA